MATPLHMATPPSDAHSPFILSPARYCPNTLLRMGYLVNFPSLSSSGSLRCGLGWEGPSLVQTFPSPGSPHASLAPTLLGDMGTNSWPPCRAPHLSYHPHTFKGEDGCAEEQQERLPACHQRQAAVTRDLLKREAGCWLALLWGGHLRSHLMAVERALLLSYL